MAEDGEFIYLKDIRIEPQTFVYHKPESVMGGQYVPPWGNPMGHHEIFLDTFDSEKSTTLQRMGRAVENIRNPNQSTEINNLFSNNERGVVATRLEHISNRLSTDEEYKRSMRKCMEMHEEMHRLREVRFPTEGFNVDDLVMDNLLNGMESSEEYRKILEGYYKGLNQFAIHDEAYAQVEGVRNTHGRVAQDVRQDFVFMTFALSVQDMLLSPDPDILGSLYKIHRNPALPIFLPSHELSEIIIAFGEGDLSMRVMRGEVTEEEYKQIARKSIRRAVINPESILHDLDNKNSLVIEVNRSLGDSVRLVNEAVSQMNGIYETNRQNITVNQ